MRKKAPIEFDPGSFSDVFDPNGGIGLELWTWMWREDNVIRMETASELKRVAVEPLQQGLLQHFEPQIIRRHRIKQLIGRMARQIMESRNYKWIGKDYKVTTGDLFITGSKYRRQDQTG